MKVSFRGAKTTNKSKNEQLLRFQATFWRVLLKVRGRMQVLFDSGKRYWIL